MSTNLLIHKHALQASICKDSCYEFVKTFWDIVIQDPYIDNWHIKYLCDELQAVAERVFVNAPKEYDLLINISPGTTKSTICSVMFPAWVWTRMARARIITSSYAYPLSLELSRRGRSIVRSDLYQALFPHVALSKDQDTKGHFANTAGGSRYSTSTGGTVTGMHGHFILIDDPLNPDPRESPDSAEIKAANNFVTNTLPTRKVDKEVSVMIMIMQRLHQNDPSGLWLERRKRVNQAQKIRHICLPAEQSDNISPPEAVRFYKHGLMDCTRLSQSVLDDLRAELGDRDYNGQFGQRPVPKGGDMFKVDNLTIELLPPRTFTKIVRYWDKAGKQNSGCYSVGAKLGVDLNGRFWVLDVIRGQWNATNRERIIRETAENDGEHVDVWVEQEGGSGGLESAENTIKNLAGFNVYKEQPKGDKVSRANPFAVQVGAGNVTLLQGEWNADYIDEMRHFPNSKFKDQIDASSAAFAQISRKPRRAGAIL